MSQSKSFKSRLVLERFGGIRSTPADGGELVVSDIQNFQLLGDGSLKKRSGYGPILRNSDPVRAFLTVQREEGYRVYLLMGTRVAVLDPDTGALTQLGSVTMGYDKAQFFFFGGSLYLIAGLALYCLDGDTLTSVQGYIPLVGKDWPNNTEGTIHEPLNLMHKKGRMTYVASDPPSIFFRTPYPVSQVYRVLRNGEELASDQYYLDQNFDTLNILGCSAGDRLEVYLLFATVPNEHIASLLSTTHHVSLGTAKEGRLCLWGDGEPNTVFCSRSVSEEQSAASVAAQANSVPLYFPSEEEFQVGDGQFPIRDITPYRDRLLIFTAGDTWMATADPSAGSTVLLTNVNASFGCPSPLGVTLAGNDPITVGRGTILRWRNASDGASEAESLSAAVDGRLGADLYPRAELCYFQAENELWLNDSARQVVWICQLSRGEWFRYINVSADRLICLGSVMGFFKDGVLYAFDSTRTKDLRASGMTSTISGQLSCSYVDFGTDAPKTLSGASIRANPLGAPITLRLDGGDLRSTCTVTLNREERTGFGIYSARCASGRFRCATLTLRAEGSVRTQLYGLSLSAK